MMSRCQNLWNWSLKNLCMHWALTVFQKIAKHYEWGFSKPKLFEWSNENLLARATRQLSRSPRMVKLRSGSKHFRCFLYILVWVFSLGSDCLTVNTHGMIWSSVDLWHCQSDTSERDNCINSFVWKINECNPPPPPFKDFAFKTFLSYTWISVSHVRNMCNVFFRTYSHIYIQNVTNFEYLEEKLKS